MATAHEIALQLLPWFAENVVARNPPLSYGYYAGKIGRDPAKEAIIVGHAMHAIGAVCVIRQLPVAPCTMLNAWTVKRGRSLPPTNLKLTTCYATSGKCGLWHVSTVSPYCATE